MKTGAKQTRSFTLNPSILKDHEPLSVLGDGTVCATHCPLNYLEPNITTKCAAPNPSDYPEDQTEQSVL